VLLT